MSTCKVCRKITILTNSMAPFAAYRNHGRLDRDFKLVIIDDFEKDPEKFLHDIEGILLFPILGNFVSKQLLDKLPNLKVIFNNSVGVEHFDFEVLRDRRVRFAKFGKEVGESVAEFGMALLLAAARGVTHGNDYVRSGEKRSMIDAFFNYPLGVQVIGSTIGIVGMGSIGYRIAEMACHGFGMSVRYHNRTRRPLEDERKIEAVFCPTLHQLLPEVDFLVVACPETEATNSMMGKTEFELMKKTAIIINISRGAIIDQDALVDALKSDVIGGAALDVTTPEPLPPDHELLKLPNVIVTPHIATATTAERLRMLECSLSNLEAGVAGEPMPNEVDINTMLKGKTF